MPLNEKNANRVTTTNDYRLNAGANYHFNNYLTFYLNYQYSKADIDADITNDVNSYYTRNLINKFSEINYQNRTVTRAINLGSILNRGRSGYENTFFRTNLNFNKTFNSTHQINAIAGYEVQDNETVSEYRTLYGYDPSISSEQQINYFMDYPVIPVSMGSQDRIPFEHGESGTTDRFTSYFGNASYIYDKRYSLYASARKDESNLFGVKTNQRGLPLWSVGASWNISNEKFFKVPWLSLLKLRVTNGYSGNINKSTSAYITTEGSPYLNTFQ